MKNLLPEKHVSLNNDEKSSAKLLMNKMGLTKREYEEISAKYGVNASKLIEVMQMGRYRYVHAV
jgi:glycerol-3-phosphate dehydrogenase